MKNKNTLVIDEKRLEVFLDGERVNLSHKEYHLLLTLRKGSDRIWKREDLLKKIWGADYADLDTRTVDQHVTRLRRKLEPTAKRVQGGKASRTSHRFIETVSSGGYRIAAGV
jgi:two-component system alkaline phosphatase synthesis response regulator PhoP